MPNYLTPHGAKKLASELDQLMRVERPRVVKKSQKRPRRAIARRMPNTFTANGACAKSIGVCAGSPNEWKAPS